MTTDSDTTAQAATRYIATPYGKGMTKLDTAVAIETDNERQAKSAEVHVQQCEEALAKARADRNKWLRLMHTEDGLTAREIARRVGLSHSALRWIVDRPPVSGDA